MGGGRGTLWQLPCSLTGKTMSENLGPGSITIAPCKSVALLQRARTFSHAISILGPRDGLEFPNIKAPNVLRLSFDDVGYTSEFGRAPSKNEIGELIDFARSWAGVGNLLIHCKAGTSRSPAAALISIASINVSGKHQLLRKIIALKNYYRPNSSMLRIADQLLGEKTLYELVRTFPRLSGPQDNSHATIYLGNFIL